MPETVVKQVCNFCEKIFYTPLVVHPERCCYCGNTSEVDEAGKYTVTSDSKSMSKIQVINKRRKETGESLREAVAWVESNFPEFRKE